MQQSQTYRGLSREYLTKAFKELEDGELTQASEKGWGAAAQIVKAVANERGMDHSSHRDLILRANELTRETGDREIEIQFDIASALHRNFYEDTLDPEAVEWRLEHVARFVDRMEGMLQSE